MARIRSVHPGLWTDEAFMSLSSFARLMAIGLWNECDDQGAFPWKPITLKVRILPSDTVDASVLLEELVSVGMICRYTVGSDEFGAVRNFRKFQRPEKPKALHPMPQEIMDYVGLGCTTHTGSDKKAPPYGGGGTNESGSDRGGRGDSSNTGSRQVADHSPTSHGISGQMEDGGDKMEKESKPFASLTRGNDADFEFAVSSWNEMAAAHGLSRVSRLTEQRKRHLRQRLSDCGGVVGWTEAMRLVTESPFLLGQRGDWKADFDFVLQASSFTKLMEGSYGNRGRALQTGPESLADRMRRSLADPEPETPDIFRPAITQEWRQ